MKRTKTLITVLAVGLLGTVVSARADLAPGDDIPEFSMKGSDGKTYSLDDFKGKQAFVIAWYPKAFTGG